MSIKPQKQSTKPQVRELLPGYAVENGPAVPERMAVFLWGPAGDGKTTWAATMPGKKLWLSFGDNEHVPVANRKDVDVVRLYDMGYADVFKHGVGDNPFGLGSYLAEHDDVTSVIVDSATALVYKGLEKAIADGVGRSRIFTPTMQEPGRSAYGGRNANAIAVMSSLLKVTARYNVHILFTGHEDDPTTDQDGTVLYIAASLGGKIINQVTWRLSEIWNLRQDHESSAKNRFVTVRAYGKRKPLKTRMFDQKTDAVFTLNYDPDKADDAAGQMTIAGFYDQWLAADKWRIPTPKGKAK